jgi:hypothetical protein
MTMRAAYRKNKFASVIAVILFQEVAFAKIGIEPS